MSLFARKANPSGFQISCFAVLLPVGELLIWLAIVVIPSLNLYAKLQALHFQHTHAMHMAQRSRKTANTRPRYACPQVPAIVYRFLRSFFTFSHPLSVYLFSQEPNTV
jgi:hypothetical protein